MRSWGGFLPDGVGSRRSARAVPGSAQRRCRPQLIPANRSLARQPRKLTEAVAPAVNRHDVAGDTAWPLPTRDQRGQLFHAELAARELGSLTLADALALTALIAKEDPARYGRAAVRWHGRFALEAKGLELVDSQLALAALASLPHDEKAALAVLFRLGGRHGVSGLDAR